MIILSADLIAQDQSLVLDDLICMNQNDVYLDEKIDQELVTGNIIGRMNVGNMDNNISRSISAQDDTLLFSDVLDINMPDIFVC